MNSKVINFGYLDTWIPENRFVFHALKKLRMNVEEK